MLSRSKKVLVQEKGSGLLETLRNQSSRSHLLADEKKNTQKKQNKIVPQSQQKLVRNIIIQNSKIYLQRQPIPPNTKNTHSKNRIVKELSESRTHQRKKERQHLQTLPAKTEHSQSKKHPSKSQTQKISQNQKSKARKKSSQAPKKITISRRIETEQKPIENRLPWGVDQLRLQKYVIQTIQKLNKLSQSRRQEEGTSKNTHKKKRRNRKEIGVEFLDRLPQKQVQRLVEKSRSSSSASRASASCSHSDRYYSKSPSRSMHLDSSSRRSRLQGRSSVRQFLSSELRQLEKPKHN